MSDTFGFWFTLLAICIPLGILGGEIIVQIGGRILGWIISLGK